MMTSFSRVYLRSHQSQERSLGPGRALEDVEGAPSHRTPVHDTPYGRPSHGVWPLPFRELLQKPLLRSCTVNSAVKKVG